MGAVIGGFIALVVLVVIVMSVFHVSAGVAWVIVLIGVAAFICYRVFEPRLRKAGFHRPVRPLSTQPSTQTEYEKLLRQLIAGDIVASDVRIALPNAEAASALAPREKHRIAESALAEYAERLLADDQLTAGESARLSLLADDLGVVLEPELDRRVTIAYFNAGNLPALDEPNLLPQSGEIVHAETPASLRKEVAVRETRGGYGGVSVRVAKGVRISTGGLRARSVVVGTQLTVADEGILSITNERVVFLGAKTSIEMPYKKVLNLEMYDDGLQFHLTGRVAAPLFTGFDGPLFAAVANTAIQRERFPELAQEQDRANDQILEPVDLDSDPRFEQIGRALDRELKEEKPHDPDHFLDEQAEATGLDRELIRRVVVTWSERRSSELAKQVERLEQDSNATKTCPDCAETVKAAARKCRYCGYRFDQVAQGS